MRALWLAWLEWRLRRAVARAERAELRLRAARASTPVEWARDDPRPHRPPQVRGGPP
jgi:hypothetical protein